MNFDEFAFANQQLAGMLRSGIPLEGALRQLSQTMRRGRLRSELQALEADLARGLPLPEALSQRDLPPLYLELIKVGIQSNNLPAVLTMVADHYQKMHMTWTRLKGLLVYPVIVLLVSLALSVFVAFVYGRFISEASVDFRTVLGVGFFNQPSPWMFILQLWIPVGLLGVITAGVIGALAIPGWRQWLRWRVPAFKEAGLAQLASAMALMLEQGCNAGQATALLAQLHADDPMRTEMEQWRTRLAAGHKQFTEIAAGGKIVPPLFVWLVAGSGEDWAGGFKQAAELFHARAMHRLNMMLYAVLPVSVMVLGFLIVCQVAPMARLFLSLMNLLGGNVSMEGTD